MTVAMSAPVDNRVYTGNGTCFIRLGESLVELFEDTSEGLSRTLYLNTKDDNIPEPAPATRTSATEEASDPLSDDGIQTRE